MWNWNAIAALAGALATAISLLTLAWQMRQTRWVELTSQASKITAWTEQSSSGAAKLVVHNYSEGPIFNVKLAEFSAEPGLAVASVIPPKERVEVAFSYTDPLHVEGPAPMPVAFIDSRGFHWTFLGYEGIPSIPGKGDMPGAFERRTVRSVTRLHKELIASGVDSRDLEPLSVSAVKAR